MDDFEALKAEAEDVLYNVYTKDDALDILFEAIEITCADNDRTMEIIYKYIVDNYGYIKD